LKVGTILVLLAILAGLAGYYFFSKPDESQTSTTGIPESRPLVWDVDMNDLPHCVGFRKGDVVEITAPQERVG